MERSSQLLLTCLLNACWQIALVTAVAALCSWLLRETAARYRHLIWVAALALCICLPVLTGLQISRGAGLEIQPEEQIAVEPAVLASTQIRLESPGPISPKKTNSLIPVSRNLAIGLLAFYSLFLCYRAARLLNAWRLTRVLARSVSTIELPAHARAIIERCKTALGVKRVRVFSSTAIPLPITVGSLNPLVILPEQLLLEDDRDVLTSAIGHEMVHVSRRDYALNLIYELVYLPLSFHPAAALVRRRIRETRELSCDELVADKLLEADAYARSLVQLAGSALTMDRQTTITVGITDADILEERVMTILRRQKVNILRKNLLLAAATLLLAVPCIAALPLGLRINIHSADAGVASGPNETQEGQQRKKGAWRRNEVVMPALSAKSEAGTLAAWLKKPGDSVQPGDVIARVTTSKGTVDVPASTSGVIERLIVAAGQKATAGSVIAIIGDQGWALSTELAETQQQELERQTLIKVLEAQVEIARQASAAARTPQEAEQKARQQAELERELVERVAQEKRGTVTATTAATNRAELEAQETLQNEVRLRISENTEHAMGRLRFVQESQDPEILARRLAERQTEARQQAELAKQATLSMQQAIQIATNQYPGTVLESRLVRERNQPTYLLMILSDNGTETTTTRVLISGVDGSVLNATKQ